MTKGQTTLVARGAFLDSPRLSSSSAGVIAHDRDGLGIASVLVRRGQDHVLALQAKERFGIEIASGPRRSATNALAFVGTAPGSWLAISEAEDNGFSVSLAEALGNCAAIADQSDGYAVLRVSGQRVRETLCKLVPIDLHPRTFSVGDVAVTVAAHIGVMLWRLQDELNGDAVFELAMYRSLAGSFWTALSESAGEFGFNDV